MQLTLFEPHSNWSPPTEFPNLNGVKLLGLDVESHDPHLKTRGPGYIRGDARVVGVSIATRDMAWYFPFGHSIGPNLDKDKVIRFLDDVLGEPNRIFVGANIQYEYEALDSLGLDLTKVQTRDIQLTEALINEESPQGYSLEVLAQAYLGQGKDETLLHEAASAFGVDPKSGLWQLSSRYIGPYAEFDAKAPVVIWQKQLVEIDRQGLRGILELENKVLPILWLMRKNGIPIDIDAAKKLSNKLRDEEDQLYQRTQRDYCGGNRLDVWSGPVLSHICQVRGIDYPRTNKGNPSFTKEFLESANDPFFQAVRDIRETNRLRTTFIDSWILGNQIVGRVHPQWKQLASDDGGTRTGRLAAANPNPQQVPSRTDRGKTIRSLFRAADGKLWCKIDYSQQEPRILVHFATLLQFQGAQDACDAYHRDRKMDFYKFMMAIASVDRRTAKDLYLGRCYNMGPPKLADKLGVEIEDAKEILRGFDAKLPFIRRMSEFTEQKARQRGFIKTLLGRKRHFNFWEPANRYAAVEKNKDPFPVATEEMARKKWPGLLIQRAMCSKALNSLIQGSAADMTKAAMVMVYHELGLIPVMQVHDELNYNVDNEEEAIAIQRCMERCVEMVVPIVADLDLGETWK